LRPAVFDWLFAAAEKTSSGMTREAALRSYGDPLEALAATTAANAAVRRAAADAFMRLQASSWVPRQCLMHGDLWYGNLMLKTRQGLMPRWADRLTVIDWGGSRVDGYPLLACEPSDGTASALAAVGSFLISPGCAATDKLCEIAEGIHDLAREAQRSTPR
jgi:hypothetical protein